MRLPGHEPPVITRSGKIRSGPFPCFAYPTIAQRLDERSISWRYYVDSGTASLTLNAYDAIKYVREGPDWKTDVATPTSRVFADLKDGTLTQVSWVVSGLFDGDGPFSRSAHGPRWLSSIVQAAQKSRYWPHLAIVVLWASDGNEMFYDHVPPPQYGRVLGLGLRVPMLVISPYAKRGHVSHTTYENGGSTLRFIEETFGLKPLGTTDVTANSIRDCFVQ